jgi:hypothetical protein
MAEKLIMYVGLNGDGSLGYSWMHSYPNSTSFEQLQVIELSFDESFAFLHEC